MYRANPSDTTIPSKQIKIYPDARIDYFADGKGINDIRFHMPEYLDFVDPRQLRISANITMSGRGKPQPKQQAAAHSLIRNMRLQDGNALVVLEEVLEYNSMVAQQYSYEENENIIKHRELFEGLSKTTAQSAQLFWNADKVDNTENTSNGSPKKVNVELPIHSGLLGASSKIVPISALKGLRLSLILDKVKNSVETGLDKNVYVETVGTGLSLAGNTTITQKTALDDTQDVTFTYNSSSETPGVLMPVQVGDRLHIVEGSNTKTALVVATKFNSAGSGTYTLKLCVEQATSVVDQAFTSAAAKVYLIRNERLNGYTPANVGTTHATAISSAKAPVSFTISDVEMKLLQVFPSPAYVSAMASKISSGEGLTMNYKNKTLYKVNTTGVNGLLNLHIPLTEKRSYALNCSPLPVSWDYDENNLVGEYDSLQSYIWSINGRLVPDRPVSMTPYAQVNGILSQQHLHEVRKSLLNSGVVVRNLQDVKQNLLISRAFSKYGLVSDVTKTDLSLRLEYEGSTKQKVFNCFICNLRSLNISNKGVQVVY
jgi:hypothetical protein